ncbi:MAG: DUF4258 domain-containing protein [Chloroflexi bacterium]|nr:MAG: DUF4258 domain-containing protein [Chloroflexota bacterium]
MAIVYTYHSLRKFKLLEQHGFRVTSEQVEETLTAPNVVIPQQKGRYIAQKRISQHYVLRVVYRKEGDNLVVITFYPGRRERYEVNV